MLPSEHVPAPLGIFSKNEQFSICWASEARRDPRIGSRGLGHLPSEWDGSLESQVESIEASMGQASQSQQEAVQQLQVQAVLLFCLLKTLFDCFN